MDYDRIIHQYYDEDAALRRILVVHSEAVARKALQIADVHPNGKATYRLCIGSFFSKQPCFMISASVRPMPPVYSAMVSHPTSVMVS